MCVCVFVYVCYLAAKQSKNKYNQHNLPPFFRCARVNRDARVNAFCSGFEWKSTAGGVERRGSVCDGCVCNLLLVVVSVCLLLYVLTYQS